VLVLLCAAGGAAWYYKDLWWPAKEKKLDMASDDLPRVRARVQELMGNDGDPGQIFDGAKRLLDSSDREMRDVGMSALDYLANKKHWPAAQLKLGQLYDPRYFQADRSNLRRPDPYAAAEQYKAAGNSPEAANELKGLCEKIAQPLEGVDEQARTDTVAQFCN